MKGIVCFIVCFGTSGPPELPTPTAGEFCQTMRNVLAGDDLRFSRDELAHLSRKHKVTIASLKRTYRRKCLPQ